MIPRRGLAALAIAGAGLGAAAPAAAQQPEAVPGQVLVRFEPGVAASGRAATLDDVDGRVLRALPIARTTLVRTPGQDPVDAARELARDPRVQWAEPNWIYRASIVPNDPLFGQQWGLLNSGQSVGGVSGTPGADIGATLAWDANTGSPNVRIAVVDGGVDRTHPDLAPSASAPANAGEAGAGRDANGVDDDANGFVDDAIGWDFVTDDRDPQDEDTGSHGSHVAGIITAQGNDGAGIAGTVWRSRLFGLRALDSNGTGSNADVASAFRYAADRGARVVNASLGGPSFSNAMSDAVSESPNTLFVVAAGNGGNDGVGDNTTTSPEYPCNLTQENLVCVAATDSDDQLASFSNFGTVAVDLAAPGVDIASSRRGNTFALGDGTSFAAPFVAGVAAQVLSANPAATTRQLRGAILAGVQTRPSLTGLVATGGRLSAPGALASVPGAGPGPGGATGAAFDVTASSARITGTTPTALEPLTYYFDYGPTTAYGEQTATRRLPPGTVGREVSEGLGALPAGVTQHFRLVVAGIGGITFGEDRVFTPPAAAPPAASALPIGPRDISVVRRGRSWFIRLRLTSFTTVTGLVDRRPTRTAKFRRAFGILRKGYGPGIRLIPLGRLRPSFYRLTLNVNSAAGPQRLRRGFRVKASPIVSLRVVTIGGVTAARVRLATRASLRGSLERRNGSRFLFLRPYQVTLGAGTKTIRLGNGLQPGLYRLRLSAPALPGEPQTVSFRLR